MPETARCPACVSERVGPCGPYRHRSALFARCARMQCLDCGMVFASPMPEPEALEAFNAGYFVNAHGENHADAVAWAFHSAINRLRVAYVEAYLAPRRLEVRSVLEIGPGKGHFARHWLARHPQTRYHAIETDASCHSTLQELGVALHARPRDLREPVDLLVLSHVLEHTADPLGFLGAAANCLRPGGAQFIEVPCRDWEFKAEDEPHLLFFDKASIGKLLARAGYRDVMTSYHGREIRELRTGAPDHSLLAKVRYKLLALGIVAPFGRSTTGLEPLTPLERAAVAPFRAHVERQNPAWWLRAVACKA